jgi:hypothetical protein
VLQEVEETKQLVRKVELLGHIHLKYVLQEVEETKQLVRKVERQLAEVRSEADKKEALHKQVNARAKNLVTFLLLIMFLKSEGAVRYRYTAYRVNFLF